MPPSRTGRLRAGAGVGAEAGAGVGAGVETGDCAGVGADPGLGASAGFALVGRVPPPMSSSAVQGRSLITSSRLNANRSSSPSSNARFACLAAEAVTPRPLRDALLDPILSHPFEILTFIDYMELALRPTLGFVHSRTRAQKGRGAGALTICRRRQPLPR